MKLIIGLGNPGTKYELTRHNAGFLAVDYFAKIHKFPEFKQKLGSNISQGKILGENYLLIKPQAFMNLSGAPVAKAMQYFKLELPDIVVIHDELALPLGKVKTKIGGGSAGHNGIKDIDAHIGNEYKRIRIGIGHPGDRDLVSDYVLNRFRSDEFPLLEQILQDVAKILV